MGIQDDKDFAALPEVAKLYQACKERDLTIAEREYLKGARDAWQAKAQAVPGGFVVVPKEPTEDQWGGLARVFGRYMQAHNRYCPKTLAKHLRYFWDKPIPDWLNKEVRDWDSEHAFATADLPVFVFKAMIEAQGPANTDLTAEFQAWLKSQPFYEKLVYQYGDRLFDRDCEVYRAQPVDIAYRAYKRTPGNE